MSCNHITMEMLTLLALFIPATASGAGSCTPGADNCVADEGLSLLQSAAYLTSQSLLQLDHQEQRKLLSDAGSNSRALLQTMRDLATAAANGTYQADDITLQVLQSIITQMKENVINVTYVNHKEDQREVDRSHAVIVSCTTTMQNSFTASTTGIDALKALMQSASTTHSTCRGKQKTLNSTKQDECGDWDTYASNLAVPDCAATFPSVRGEEMETCITTIKNWSALAETTYAGHKQDCTTATTNLNNKKTTCDSNQGKFESDFCTYGQKLTSTCGTYSSCRSTNIGSHTATVADVKVSEASRKAEYEAAKRIICYIGVFKSTAAERPAVLKACNEATYDTKQLNIDYGTVSAAATCDTSPVASKPCDNTFLTSNYTSQDWFTLAPTVACTPCNF